MTQIKTTHESTGRRRVQTLNELPSKTVQSDFHDANIHEILKKYPTEGIIDHLAKVDMQFLDVSEFTDYHDAYMHAAEAQQRFMELPSKLREVFNHDHLEWLDAAHNKNIEPYRAKLEKLGLLEPKATHVEVDPQNASGGPTTANDPPASV